MAKIISFPSSKISPDQNDLEAFLQRHFEEKNRTGKSEFLGLSPEQMHKILYSEIEFGPGNFISHNKVDDALLLTVPAVKESLFLLNKIDIPDGVKLTERGNLPRKLVKEMWGEFFSIDNSGYEPNREEDCSEIVRIKWLLESCGMIKTRKNKIYLTKSGKSALVQNSLNDLYAKLLKACFNDWNWAYMDRYSSFEIIQMAGPFGLFIIRSVAQEWITAKEIGLKFLEAFPAATNGAKGHFGSPAEDLLRCFQIRFLRRVCVPLGILTSEERESPFSLVTDKFKVTSFFREAFKFDLSF